MEELGTLPTRIFLAAVVRLGGFVFNRCIVASPSVQPPMCLRLRAVHSGSDALLSTHLIFKGIIEFRSVVIAAVAGPRNQLI